MKTREEMLLEAERLLTYASRIAFDKGQQKMWTDQAGLWLQLADEKFPVRTS